MMDDLVRLRALLSQAHPVPWELQDGCSWRRIGTKHGPSGNVLCPTTCRHDGHPDLTASDGRLYDNLALIVEGVNALPDLLAKVQSLTEANASLERALTRLEAVAERTIRELRDHAENISPRNHVYPADMMLREANRLSSALSPTKTRDAYDNVDVGIYRGIDGKQQPPSTNPEGEA